MIKGAVRHTFNTTLLFRSMCFDQVNGMTKVFIRKNWKDTEKISLVPGVRMTRINREVYRNLFFLCVCVCVFSSHSFWTSSSLDVPAGVTQEEGHTRFLIHLLSAVRAFIFLARRIRPFLSLVDREVEFCVLTIYSFSTRWAFLFLF